MASTQLYLVRLEQLMLGFWKMDGLKVEVTTGRFHISMIAMGWKYCSWRLLEALGMDTY